MVPVVVGILALAVGIAAGFFIRKTMAASDAQSIEARAQKTLLEAEREADATRVRAIQEAREESATMRREAEEDVRARREEISRLESRILESETDLRKRVATIESRTLELQERDEKLQFVREQLEKAADQHRAELERIAGMTSDEAKEHLVSQVVDEAKRAAMTQVREIEQRAREEGDERARKIVTIAIQRVASEQTAESTVSVFALPERGHEGPHHRPRGTQHPRLRGHDRREPHHRRHARGGRAVVLRSRAARGGADDAREARRRRPDPSRADRGDPRAVAPRAGGADPAGGRGRRRRGRHHRHPPRDDQAPRPAPVPDLVRPERPQAPGRVRAHRRGARRRDRRRRRRSPSGARSCTTSGRPSPTRSRARTRSSAPRSRAG